MVGRLFDPGDVEEYVRDFRGKLRGESDDEAFTRQWILHGDCSAVAEDRAYSLKRRIAEKFSLEPIQDVFIVGSAKLGFSISPSQRYKPFDDESDIDVAIVSHDLYQKIWHEVHLYKESGADWPKRAKFEQYCSWGWIRPDMLPSSPIFSFADEWWKFFRELQRERVAGPFKVAAALYHDISFLIRYQSSAVAKCRDLEYGGSA